MLRRLLTFALLVVACTGAPAEPVRQVIFLADTQQRELAGAPTGFSDQISDHLSRVAIRSSEQELFARFILPEILRSQSRRTLTFHLGDMLDYSCESEWLAAQSALSDQDWAGLFLLPGNHDGLFQGNGGYGPLVRFNLHLLKMFVSKNYDPSLEGHFKNVCWTSHTKAKPYENAEFRKRDFFCSYLAKRAITNPQLLTPFAEQCTFVEKARHERVEDSNGAVIFQTTPLRLEANDTTPWTHGVAASFTGKSTGKWSPGYFSQSVVIDMSTDGSADSKRIAVVLLDTQDWNPKPEYRGDDCSQTHNTACGEVSVAQRQSVEALLQSVPREMPVIFSGHYPLAEMSADTSAWIKSKVSSRLPHLYISAHTHKGYVNKDNGVTEVNLDSLMDWPVGYWSAEIKVAPARVCLQVHDAWKELGCASALGARATSIKESAQSYRDNSKPWWFDSGETQWQWRARDAARTIASFPLGGSGRLDCKIPNVGTSSVTHTATSKSLQACMNELGTRVSADASLRRVAACSAIAGASAFRDSDPGLPRGAVEDHIRSTGNSKYAGFCIPIEDAPR